MAPSLAPEIRLSVMSALPAAELTETPMPIWALRIRLSVTLTSRGSVPADHYAVTGSALNDIAVHDAVGLHRDADVARVHVLAEEHVADEVALHHGEAAAFVQIGDEMPIAALSTMLLAITAPSKANAA